MSEFSKEQSRIDELAKRRRVYQSAAQFMASSATKDFAEALVCRIEGLRDSYIEKFDSAHAEDSLSFARFQEARKVCNTILLDFDPEVCKKAIEALDKEIKTIHDTIEKKKSKKNKDGGFGSL